MATWACARRSALRPSILAAIVLACLASCIAQEELVVVPDGAWATSVPCSASAQLCTFLTVDVPAGTCARLKVVDVGCSGDTFELTDEAGVGIAKVPPPACTEGGPESCCDGMDCGADGASCSSDGMHSFVEHNLPGGVHFLNINWVDVAGMGEGKVAAAAGERVCWLKEAMCGVPTGACTPCCA
jgi:hypothetical protein